jgi:hypothetical protein
MSTNNEGDETIVAFKSFVQRNVALPVAAMNALVSKIKVGDLLQFLKIN